jgi:glycogen phosphorylase
MNQNELLDYQAEMVFLKTKHYLITTIGRTSDEANADEFYRALSYTLREQIMISWLATSQTMREKDVKMLYYFSMEYLPGRIFTTNMANLCETEILKRVMVKANRSLLEIIDREPDPGLGNGGLGRLASCLLDSLATMHYPAQGYGLRYQYGIFEQQLWDGHQIEAPDCWLINENPWEFRRDLRKVVVKFKGSPTRASNIHGDEMLLLKDEEEVYALPYDIPIIGYSTSKMFSVLPLRLWTTKESPLNFQLQSYNLGHLGDAGENTMLTDVLYPGDSHDVGKRARLKQEFLLVSASIQDIIRHYLGRHENFNSFADKVRIQINDTHPALVVAELIRHLNQKHDLPWKTAVEISQACVSYTNHTILSEALEVWDADLLYYLLPRQYKIIERLNYDFCNTVRSTYPKDEDKVRRMTILHEGRVRMAHLAFVGAHHVNGVAELHTNILKNEVFKDFDQMFPGRIVNVTNGVTQRRWLLQANPELSAFITKHIGDGWIIDFSKIRQIADQAGDETSKEEFLAIKKKNKQSLIDYLTKNNKLRNAEGEMIPLTPAIDVNSLFDVQVKRIHEYKRQLMNALHLIMIYQEMLDNPDGHHRIQRTAIIGGKAAAGYETAKDIIFLIHCIARKINRDPTIKGALKIIFVENYNVTKAELIMPAADLSEQISTAGMEASGTGNMKLTMNGALTIGTRDGANIEMEEEVGTLYWPFAFGCSSDEIARMQAEQSYRSIDIVNNNPKIKRAVDSLINHTFDQNENEHRIMSNIYHKLLEGHYGEAADRFFVLKDLESYYNTQLTVEALYREPHRWAEYCIHNMAGMGKFSTDRAIKDYADKIWGITPCPIDFDIYEVIEKEFSEHDRCRIY